MSDNDSDELDIFHTIVTPNSKHETHFQSQCIVSLKAEFLTRNNFVMGEIKTILA